MIETIFESNHITFLQKVNKLLEAGYVLKGCECAKNTVGYGSRFDPFIYTAILIKL